MVQLFRVSGSVRGELAEPLPFRGQLLLEPAQFLAPEVESFQFGAGGGEIAEDAPFEVAADPFLIVAAGNDPAGKGGRSGFRRDCGDRFALFRACGGDRRRVLAQALAHVDQIVADEIVFRHRNFRCSRSPVRPPEGLRIRHLFF